MLHRARNVGVLAGRRIVGPASARLVIDGRPFLNFFGSGCLALSDVAEIRAAVRKTLDDGAPFAQHLPAALGARDPCFEAVEQAGAQACGTADSVYFGSGYLIGAVALASIEEPVERILLDEQAHYNLVDAAKASGAVIDKFDHCKTESLAERLANRHASMRHPPIVLTDGVFATMGDVPPLPAYAQVLARYDGRLVVDESHGFGVVGPDGRGAADYHGVNVGVIAGATLSKAFCAQGALLGCSREVAARIRRRPPIRGTGAGSPLSAAAATATLAYAAARPELREGLRAMASYLRLRLRELGVEVIDSPAPIVSFRWGRYADMQALQRRLFDREIYIYHSNYIGSGPDGVIRCAVFRDHSRQDIDTLISEMRA